MTRGSFLQALPHWLAGYAAAIVVLAVFAAVAATAIRDKSNTFDELAHITAGYSYWTRNDYRLQPEDGVLPSRWFSLPLLPLHPDFPQAHTAWTKSNVWAVSDSFFFGLGNNPEVMLWRARCMTVTVAVALGFLVYGWSRRLFGPGGGMVSLLLYATSPTILANGNLTTTDVIVAGFFTLSAGALWAMFHRISLGTLIGCWLALAGLLLSKMSAVLIVPICLALVVIRLLEKRPLTIGWRRQIAINHRGAQFGIILGAMVLQVLLVVASIWACYGFRYSAFEPPRTGQEQFFRDWDPMLAKAGVFGQGIELARQHHLLPEAYLYGLTFVYHHSQTRSAFLNGQWSLTGWRMFFPYTFLVKTPPATFVLLVLAAAGAIWTWRSLKPASDNGEKPVWRAFCATAPLWVVLVFYWGMALVTKLNIGHRHILPTYPAMFILAGAAAHWFRQSGRLRVLMSSVVVFCLAVIAVESARIYPHYLAYFNCFAGGPRNGYKHLVDSSLDWGQDLPGLKRWLKEHDLDGPARTPVYLMYFGTSRPSYYQIRATRLSGMFRQPMAPLTPGVYCISATELQHVYSPGGSGPWTTRYEETYQDAARLVGQLNSASRIDRLKAIESKGQEYWREVFAVYDALRSARLCAYLRHRTPDDNVGYSILIYRLSAKDLAEALNGPPLELSDSDA